VVEEVDERLEDGEADGRVTARQRVDADAHGTADDLERERVLEATAEVETAEVDGEDAAQLVLEEGELEGRSVLRARVGTAAKAL